MKKRLTLLLALMMCFSLYIEAKNTIVKTKTEFTTAWSSQKDGDTISVAYNNGAPLNIGAVTMSSVGGCITLMSQYPDSVALIQIEIQGVTLADGLTCGLVFENIHLQYRSPDGSSGQIIYYNAKYANFTKLIFRNCEITKSVRSLFRSVKPANTAEVTYTSCGDIDYFEMTNCKVHNTFLTSGNNWPLVYFGHLPVEMNFKNNTFYDMPYLKSIFTMNYADPAQGRNAIINFENNTVCLSGPTGGVIAPGTYLGEEAQFNFKNNLFLTPNWTNARNIHDTLYASPKILVAKFGIVSAKNNLIEGYNHWASGQSLDAEGEGAFLSLDTIPQYKMSDIGFSWSDFTSAENGDFSYLFNSALATSGIGGAPIGDPRWVLSYNNPRSLVAKANIEGPVVSPLKGVYENGSSVTLTTTEFTGYQFKNWQDAQGNVLSTENPYTFIITADMNITAVYEALLERLVTVKLSGTNTATYTIKPLQAKYYVGNVITTTVDHHNINNFQKWSDGKTSVTRTDTINTDLNLTAIFEQQPYLLSWDFCQLTANNKTFSKLPANHFKDSTNQGVMNHVGLDTISANFQTRNNKFSAGVLNYCALRKTPAANFANPDYLFIKFSTKGKSGIRVKSAIASDNCIYRDQKIQYSLNGKDYTDFSSITLPTDSTAFSTWFALEGNLPSAASDKDSVFVRWIADPTSARVFVPTSDQSFEYAYISKFVVLADEDLGGASWRVNPMFSYSPGQVISNVPGIKLTLGDGTNVWTVIDSTLNINNVTYISSINGTLNPVDGTGKKFSSSGIPPTVGAFYKFDVEENGSLEASVIVNANKTSFIVEDATAMENYNAFTVPAKAYTSYTIPVIAGKSYYFFSEGSKMGLMGFVFKSNGTDVAKPETKINDIYTSGGNLYINSAKRNAAAIYDILGKKVFSGIMEEGTNEIGGLMKGIYIVRIGNETSKIVL